MTTKLEAIKMMMVGAGAWMEEETTPNQWAKIAHVVGTLSEAEAAQVQARKAAAFARWDNLEGAMTAFWEACDAAVAALS